MIIKTISYRTILVSLFYFFALNISNAQFSFQRLYGFSSTSILKDVHEIEGDRYRLCGTLVLNGYYLLNTTNSGQIISVKKVTDSNEEYPVSFRPCNDGGTIMCGYNRMNGGNFEILISRTDSSGNFLWARTFSNFGSAYGNYATQTSDGGFIVCGNVQTNNTTVRQCLIKTDAQGFVQWEKSYSDSGAVTIGDAEFVLELNDGFLMCGRLQNVNTSGDYDATLVRTDLNGNILWGKTYGFPEWDQFNQVVQTGDGGFVACGWIDTLPGGNIRDVTLAKFDSNGNLLWSKFYGLTGDDLGFTLEETSDNGFIIGGRTNSFSPGMPDYYLLKTDSSGTLQWSYSYGASNDEQLFACHQANDGGFLIAGSTLSFGSFSENSYFVKTDSSGMSGCDKLGTPQTLSGDYILPLIADTLFEYDITNVADSLSGQSTSYTANQVMFCLFSGIDENSVADKIDVFPNPFWDEISIVLKNLNDELLSISLSDVTGRVMITKDFQGNNMAEKINLSVSELNTGVYFVRIDCKGGSVVRKVVKS